MMKDYSISLREALMWDHEGFGFLTLDDYLIVNGVTYSNDKEFYIRILIKKIPDITLSELTEDDK